MVVVFLPLKLIEFVMILKILDFTIVLIKLRDLLL